MFRYGPGFHHGPGIFAWFFLLVLVALVVLGVLAVVRLWSRPRRPVGPFPGGPIHGGPIHGGPAAPPVEPALMELRLRYARGDITWEEYRQRVARLGYPTPDESAQPPTQPPPPPSP